MIHAGGKTGELRYCFPSSSSKKLPEALAIAEKFPWFRKDDCGLNWIEFPFGEFPEANFHSLESMSRNWKGAAYYIGTQSVSKYDWWSAAEPLTGDIAPQYTDADWIEKKRWLQWGHPQLLISGDWNRRKNLRNLAAVSDNVFTLSPEDVCLRREPHPEGYGHVVTAHIRGLRVGELAERYTSICGPMEENKIIEMRVAGIVYGGRRLRVAMWPLRTLSTGIITGDARSPELAPEYEASLEAYQAYVQARGPVRRLKPTDTKRAPPPTSQQSSTTAVWAPESRASELTVAAEQAISNSCMNWLAGIILTVSLLIALMLYLAMT